MNRRGPGARLLAGASMVPLIGGCSSSGTPAEPVPPDGQASTTSVPIDGFGGELFEDEDGVWTMFIDPAWVETADATDPQAWTVAPPRHGISPEVDVIALPAGGLDVEQYLQQGLENPSRALEDLKVTDRSVTAGDDGQERGVVEFSGIWGGDSLRFLSVFVVESPWAVITTLEADPDRFDELRGRVEPYLLTLTVTNR